MKIGNLFLLNWCNILQNMQLTLNLIIAKAVLTEYQTYVNNKAEYQANISFIISILVI